jgi:hypothetical protein
MSLKKTTATLALCALATAGNAFAQFQPPAPSPKASVSQTVGMTDLSVSYSRPSVKGRLIWGELVPWDKPWRTGANQATTLTAGDDIMVEGKKLAAGTYSIVTIPGKDEWTVIFNSDTALWFQTEYAEAKDVLRVKVKPQIGHFTETLSIGFENVVADSAHLVIAWERYRVPVAITVDVKDLPVKKAKDAVAKAKADDWQTPMQVARYFADQKVSIPDALTLIDKSIAIQKNVSNVSRKARILAQAERFSDAVKTGEEAVKLAKASPEKPNMEAFEKSMAEWKAKIK